MEVKGFTKLQIGLMAKFILGLVVILVEDSEHYISNTQYVSLINRAMRKWGNRKL